MALRGTTDFQGLIEMVAAANEHQHNFTEPEELPELRTSPCLMHQRSKQTTNLSPHQQYHQVQHLQHGYPWGSPRSLTSRHSGSKVTIEELDARTQKERSAIFHQDIQNGHSQAYSIPSLPKVMPTKVFITSWLEHGSQPIGQNHFPEVIPSIPPANQNDRTKPTRVVDKKQTLAPIFRTLKAKKQKRNLQQ